MAVFVPATVIGLALAGLAIAAVGAYLPRATSGAGKDRACPPG
jgi:hypothetical protein